MKPYVNDIPPLLQEGVKVLIYAGIVIYLAYYQVMPTISATGKETNAGYMNWNGSTRKTLIL